MNPQHAYCPHCGNPLTEAKPTFLDVTFSLEGRRVHRHGTTAPLTHTEYLILRAMLDARENGLKPRALQELIWPGQRDKGLDVDNRSKVYITRLRHKVYPLGLSIDHARLAAYRLVDLAHV